MAREIKFRAWDKKNKAMVIVWGMNWEGFENDVIISMFAVNPVIKGEYILQAKDAHLMQYTGLKDKNGKEIYEGDIISYDKALFNVVFIPGAIGMKRIVAEKSKPAYRLHNIQGEVIGNIYENYELINT